MRQGSAVKSEEKEYQQLQVAAHEEPPRHRRYGTVAIKPLKVIYALKAQFKLSVKRCSQFSPNFTRFLLHRLLSERAEECHRVAMVQRVKHESEIL